MFSFIDTIIIILFLISAINGFRLGFVRSLLSLLKYIISIYLLRLYYVPVVNFIITNEDMFNIVRNLLKNIVRENILLDTISKLAIQSVVLIVLFMIFNIILDIIISKIDNIFKIKYLNGINRLLGLGFGLLKCFVILSLVISLVNPFLNLFKSDELITMLNQSVLLKYLYMYNFTLGSFNTFIEIFYKYKITDMI
ncbi:membrane protein required for colicin V production [Alkalithermobacter thermoalcaliphilus JW-YL-7 = DSM 7308]|uniref:Colicin V production protein n=1 Tax=Alkalithermobacter thermoalcaliphilus JW-YL-7 = DSM 7308 TaxID=1121328 RepID=A0A150FSZ7_CLOPD|nr:Colicin V production protein [[Clostridium] paradoxum JW-YL-7 = DSM 7308]SHL09015.1 membrane protein required for colicin V production [[Clostridium] paradoxum JW-YL-7 = DSM 7308]